MSSVSSIMTEITETHQLQETSKGNKMEFDREEMRKKISGILRKPSEVDPRTLVYRATMSTLPNPFDNFDSEKFEKRFNSMSKKSPLGVEHKSL